VAMERGLCHDVRMVKRSTRLAKRDALRAVEEAIGASLGKNSAAALRRPNAGAEKARTEKPHARPGNKASKGGPVAGVQG